MFIYLLPRENKELRRVDRPATVMARIATPDAKKNASVRRMSVTSLRCLGGCPIGRLSLRFFFLLVAAAHAALAQNHADAEEPPRLHVGVLSVPLWGHFKPLWAIAEELAYRGHTVTVVVEEPSWCSEVLRHSQHPIPLPAANLSAATAAATTPTVAAAAMLDIHCVIVPRHQEVFGAATFHPATREGSSVIVSLIGLFNDVLRHHELALGDYLGVARAIHARHPLTTMLCDFVTYACASTARKLQVPVVHSFPFTTQLSVGPHPLLPAVGLGLPRHMSVTQRTKNLAFKLLSLAVAPCIVRALNRVRADHGVPPYRDAYEVTGMYAPLITPTLWGLDIPQPLCLNVHPVGPLNTRDQRQPYRRDDLSADLAEFLDRCSQGVVYVNWGTLSVPTATLERTLLAGLVAAAPYCVVWKRHSAAATDPPSPPARFFVTSWLSSPMAVLKHPHTLAFVSHCGDTSVLEAVEAAVPIIGFPLFADQADVCQRVAESGIGVRVTQTKRFTPADVVAAITTVMSAKAAMAQRMRDLHVIAAAYGGPSRAADIIEGRQYNLLLNLPEQLERCSHLDGTLRPGNILLVWCIAVLSMSLLWICLLRSALRLLTRLPTLVAWLDSVWRRAALLDRAEARQHRVRAAPRAYKAESDLRTRRPKETRKLE